MAQRGGCGKRSFAFRTVTPFAAICIKMEEREERRGEERRRCRDGFREERAGGVNRCRKKRGLRIRFHPKSNV